MTAMEFNAQNYKGKKFVFTQNRVHAGMPVEKVDYKL